MKKQLKIGETVEVREPHVDDAWAVGFTGIVVGLKHDTDGTPLATIEDQDGDCFDVDIEHDLVDTELHF